MCSFLEAMTAHEYAKKCCRKCFDPDVAAIELASQRSVALDAAEKLESIVTRIGTNGEHGLKTDIDHEVWRWAYVAATAWRELIYHYDEAVLRKAGGTK